MREKEQVLIVTNHEERCRAIREMLAGKPESFSIIRAETAAEAREILRRSFVDVLLLEPDLLRLDGPKLPAPCAVPVRGDLSQILAYVRSYIFRYYAEPLTAEKLAALVSVTPHYLCRMFLLSEGIRIGDFLENTRLERAAALLRGTDLRIGKIARAVGFRDSTYFGRRFRAVYGVTPTEYRGKCGKVK